MKPIPLEAFQNPFKGLFRSQNGFSDGSSTLLAKMEFPLPLTPKPTSGNPGDIVVHGARLHNLKNITVAIPQYSLTVITGVSGSGKSSLAFDTIYAEGQRRYIESLSAYARQ